MYTLSPQQHLLMSGPLTKTARNRTGFKEIYVSVTLYTYMYISIVFSNLSYVNICHICMEILRTNRPPLVARDPFFLQTDFEKCGRSNDAPASTPDIYQRDHWWDSLLLDLSCSLHWISIASLLFYSIPIGSLLGLFCSSIGCLLDL